MAQSQFEKITKEKLAEIVFRAIGILIEGNVSETIIVSSHKINSILQDKLGRNFKIDRIGRALARIAKKNELEKMTTSVPKYILTKSNYQKLTIPD